MLANGAPFAPGSSARRAAGVFPAYDRAPEASYPTQVEQNYAVGQWVRQHGAEHGLDTAASRSPSNRSLAGMVHDLLRLDIRAANVARKLAVDALRTALQ